MSNSTAADWLVSGLRQRGVEWIATLCGHGLDPLFDAARRQGLRLVDVRNEQTAGYVAEAFGRLTKRPGVCASSSGVAVANALTGVMNAWFDQSPMLYLSGSANLDTLGMGCFQDCDQAGLVRPMTKYSRVLDVPQRAEQMLDEAWQAALAAPQGPVHLMLPMDVQRTEVAAKDLVRSTNLPAHPGVDELRIAEVTRALQLSRQPLIIAGSGVYYNDESAAVIDCANRYLIPVQTPIWDRGVCDQACEVFVGVAGALSCDANILARADCVILAGAAIDYRLGYLQQHTRVLRLDRGWRRLMEALQQQPLFDDWLREARTIRSSFVARVRSSAESQRVAPRMHAVDIIDAIETAVPLDATLIIDGGSIGQWAHHLLTERRYPGHWLTCGRSGVVGYGLGAAMAARLASPTRPVVLLSGDGAFTFTLGELECAVRQKLPFVVIVADDQKWGITHAGHIKQYGEGIATQLGPIRFASLAASLGARGIQVERAEDISAALSQALAWREVTVIHVPIVGGNPQQ